MTRRTYRFYGYLILLALASSLLVRLTEFDDSNRGSTAPHSPDIIGKGYSKWVADEFGQPKNKLLADEIRHYSDDGATHFVQPTLIFYDEKTPPWVIHAQSGVLSGDGENVELQGKVSASRAKAKGASGLLINTSELHVNPKTRHAQTDKPADLISSPHSTSGTGMTLIFAKPVYLKLLSHVRGKYH